MNKIYDISDEDLIAILEISAKSALPLKYKSFEYNIYISGISYGIWVSVCDMECISLTEISEILEDIILSNLN